MTPTVGSIVHYISFGTPGGEYKPACRAAVVTEVLGDPASSAGLCVLNPTGQFFKAAILHDQGADVGAKDSPLCGGRVYHAGTWHWPEMAG